MAVLLTYLALARRYFFSIPFRGVALACAFTQAGGRCRAAANSRSRRGYLVSSFVVTGVLTMMGLADPIYAAAGLPVHPLLDSNLVFPGWPVAGVGAGDVLAGSRASSTTALFRVLWLMIFAGGTGGCRFTAFVGPPPWPFIGFTLLEIAGAPFFIAWQARLARATPPDAVGLRADIVGVDRPQDRGVDSPSRKAELRNSWRRPVQRWWNWGRRSRSRPGSRTGSIRCSAFCALGE